MKLREAVLTASRFCWTGKQNSPMQFIRCIPATGGESAAVFATNGPIGVKITVDCDLPNAMFRGTLAAQAVSAAEGEVSIEQAAQNVWRLANVRLESGQVANYPSLNYAPSEFHACEDWWAVEQVLHAVSKDKVREDLQCVQFKPTAVAATDRLTVARAFIAGQWDGLVPVSVFKRFPAGDVQYSFDKYCSYFRVGDETRYAILKSGAFENCALAVPAYHAGPAYALSRERLEAALKRAKSLKQSAVSVTFQQGEIEFHAAGWSDAVAGRVLAGEHDPVSTMVAVAPFYEAVKRATTPRVQVGFTTPGDPIRVDSGPVAVGIWGKA